MKSAEPMVLPDSEYYTFAPSANTYQYLLYPILCGLFHYQGGYDLTRDAFDSFLLEIILDGQVTLAFADKTITARQNDVVLLDCYEKHRYYSQTGWKAIWIHFDGASARGYYNLIVRANGNVFQTPEIDLVRRRIRTIFNQCTHKTPFDEVQTALTLTTILTRLTVPVVTEPETGRTARNLEHLLTLISADISSPPSIREMADIMDLSPCHFIRVFTRAMGVTPKQYLLTLRMNHAKYLLTSTPIELKKTARMIGYSSESAFCTAFKRQFGITPREYRGR